MSSKRALDSNQQSSDPQKVRYTRASQKNRIIDDVRNTSIWKQLSQHPVPETFSTAHAKLHSGLTCEIMTELHAELTKTKTIPNALTYDHPISSGLFGHMEYHPFELGVLKKKVQANSNLILESSDGVYVWKNITDPDYDRLPTAEKFNTLEIFGARAAWTVLTEATLKYAGFLSSGFKPCDYIEYDAPNTIGPCFDAKNMLWDSDESFGLQRFQGVDPCQVRKARLEEMPSDLKMNDEFEYLILDYSHLETYELKEALRYGVIAPRCILSLNKAGEILPEWIALGNGLTVFRNDTWLWRYAKLIMQSAEFTHHELVDHLTRCHFITEIFVMETMKMYRTTPNVVCRLLVPHFARILAVNKGARDLLIPWLRTHLSILSPVGIDDLITQEIKHFECDLLDFEHQLTSRRFNLDNLPASYHYANDGLKLYRVLYNFNRSVLEASKIDWDIIAAWCTAIKLRIPSFPLVKDVVSLTRVVTGIIFNASIQHSALNDPQWYFWGYCPNGPATLVRSVPSPEMAIRYTDKDWKNLYFNSLPSKDVFDLQRDLVSILALGAPDNSSLYVCTDEYRAFVSNEQVDLLQNQLKDISTIINKRNEYLWLDPIRATRSVIR